MLESIQTGVWAQAEEPDRTGIYREIFEHATDGVAILDANGCYVEQNAAHAALTGYTLAELRGRTPAIHLGEEAFARIASELMLTGHYQGEHQSRAKDGTMRTLELSAFAVRDATGAIRYFVGAKRDVTLRKLGEAALQRRYEQLRAIYRMTVAVTRATALPDIYEDALACLESAIGADRTSILLLDPDGVMRFKAWHGLSAAYREAVEGHTPWSPADPNPQPITIADVATAAELSAVRAVIEGEGIRALAFVPLVFQERLLGKFMLYFNTPHLFSVEELQVAETVASQIAFSIVRQRSEEELKAANAAKSAFLATTSHELRTPLNAILGYAELLNLGVNGGLNPAQASHIERIRASAGHLIHVIEEILTFSRAEAGKEEVNIATLELEPFLAETASMVEPIARQKNLRLSLGAAEPLGTMQTDVRKLRQILLNLLSNAIKFTEEGQVQLEAVRQDGHVRFVVADTGPGIAPEHHRRIFEPFWQIEQGATRRAG
ncbi:MAG TPA: PAS domain S-box protein, partial [Longimicrobiales bacterium]|nr:PAS domain S-box protein [Longimicrobiales bacterium]